MARVASQVLHIRTGLAGGTCGGGLWKKTMQRAESRTSRCCRAVGAEGGDGAEGGRRGCAGRRGGGERQRALHPVQVLFRGRLRRPLQHPRRAPSRMSRMCSTGLEASEERGAPPTAGRRAWCSRHDSPAALALYKAAGLSPCLSIDEH